MIKENNGRVLQNFQWLEGSSSKSPVSLSIHWSIYENRIAIFCKFRLTINDTAAYYRYECMIQQNTWYSSFPRNKIRIKFCQVYMLFYYLHLHQFKLPFLVHKLRQLPLACWWVLIYHGELWRSVFSTFHFAIVLSFYLQFSVSLPILGNKVKV